MRRTIAVGAMTCLFVAVPATALAQEDSTPTTIVTEATTVERDVTLTTTETRELEALDDDDDDDSDKTGLWGLLGLLGLIGLAGLRKHRDDYVPTTSTRVQADTTPRGSTSPDH